MRLPAWLTARRYSLLAVLTGAVCGVAASNLMAAGWGWWEIDGLAMAAAVSALTVIKVTARRRRPGHGTSHG
jgi:hypothetical protein